MSRTMMPDVMPVLSQGKHRSPRNGACFMEFASYLAGEPWSDHPKCTHPLLASLARMVNDFSSDQNRSELAALTPSVIGLTSDDPRLSVLIALRAATCALPVSSADRQRALAVGILSCERALIELDGRISKVASDQVARAFALVPDAESWAREFITALGFGSTQKFVKQVSRAIVRTAVEGVAHACVSETDMRLRVMLSAAIDDCVAFLRQESASTPVTVASDPAAPSKRATVLRPQVGLVANPID